MAVLVQAPRTGLRTLEDTLEASARSLTARSADRRPGTTAPGDLLCERIRTDSLPEIKALQTLRPRHIGGVEIREFPDDTLTCYGCIKTSLTFGEESPNMANEWILDVLADLKTFAAAQWSSGRLVRARRSVGRCGGRDRIGTMGTHAYGAESSTRHVGARSSSGWRSPQRWMTFRRRSSSLPGPLWTSPMSSITGSTATASSTARGTYPRAWADHYIEQGLPPDRPRRAGMLPALPSRGMEAPRLVEQGRQDPDGRGVWTMVSATRASRSRFAARRVSSPSSR